MNNSAELAVHMLLSNLRDGKTSMSETTVDQITRDVRESLLRQFSGEGQQKFRLRASNVGQDYCQLWFKKNHPEKATPLPDTFLFNMVLGDFVEAVFKGLLTEAKVDYEDAEELSLKLTDTVTIKGTTDLSIDGAVDDVKSASPWSYTNKFASFDKLQASDPFGYVGQLAVYSKGLSKKVGGWWVVNKANGQFKYVPADSMDLDKEVSKLEDTVTELEANEFRRCYEPEEEKFRGKPTGNIVLNSACKFCDFKHSCWEGLDTRPSIPSQAKFPAEVDYIYIKEEDTDA